MGRRFWPAWRNSCRSHIRRPAKAFAFALLIAEATLLCQPAIAREPHYRIDIPAGPIGESLSIFTQATGVSVGWSGTLPRMRVARLRGSMSADEALRRLLAGTPFKARRAGANTFRIERDGHPGAALPRIPSDARTSGGPPPAPASLEDIVVTGQKRPLTLQQVPMSLAVVELGATGSGRLSAGSHDLAFSIEGLALTNLGPGRNRQFIRGVADSPFNGPSQSTVAVQLDEARVTFDAPDPDLRLTDVQRVEILKGPQGPLYGSGALGGIYHIVTRKPELAVASGNARLTSEAVQHGSLGVGTEAMWNLPLVTDRLAVRGVGYVLRGGGWIDNIGRNHNANVTRVTGGRIALRWQPDPAWTVDLAAVLQDVNSADSQYVTTSDDTISRRTSIAEPTDNDFKSMAGTVQGRIGAIDVLATTSHVDHGVDYVLDATGAAAQFGLAGAARFLDDRQYNIWNHEIRLSSADNGRWIAGLSYLRARSHNQGTIGTAIDSVTVEASDRRVAELAIFGEGEIKLADRLNATVGARLFRTIAEDETAEQSGGATQRISKLVLSPSISLAWRPADRSLAYLRYARAVRPGGLAPSGETAFRSFDSDELGTVDLGFRHDMAARGIGLEASIFSTDWRHIQSDYLLPSGLVSTRNAGRGRIRGAEMAANWQPLGGLRLSIGGSYLHGMLVRTEDGLELDDRRMPIAPTLTGRLGARYDFAIAGWSAMLSAQTNYIGRARLTFDEDLDRDMGDYAVASTAMSATHGRITIDARVDNLFDIRGDSFAFGNPFSIMEARQYTPLRPRTFTLSIATAW